MSTVTGTLLGLCLLIAGCVGVEIKPGDKSHARREIPPGPGILTGQKGEFVLYRSGESAGEEDQADSEQGQSEEPNF